jgi:hypothetical protein
MLYTREATTAIEAAEAALEKELRTRPRFPMYFVVIEHSDGPTIAHTFKASWELVPV